MLSHHSSSSKMSEQELSQGRTLKAGADQRSWRSWRQLLRACLPGLAQPAFLQKSRVPAQVWPLYNGLGPSQSITN